MSDQQQSQNAEQKQQYVVFLLLFLCLCVFFLFCSIDRLALLASCFQILFFFVRVWFCVCHGVVAVVSQSLMLLFCSG